MIDIYENSVKFEDDDLLIRFISKKDAHDLLKVYSDVKAVPLFNSDNCNGDDFYYTSEERMIEVFEYWNLEYENKGFVRWAILDKQKGVAIGTIEIFHRDANDYYTNCGLLRLDLRSDYEKSDIIEKILTLIIKPVFSLFHCDKVATKAIPEAIERRKALEKYGFITSKKELIGHDGSAYRDYFVYVK